MGIVISEFFGCIKEDKVHFSPKNNQEIHHLSSTDKQLVFMDRLSLISMNDAKKILQDNFAFPAEDAGTLYDTFSSMANQDSNLRMPLKDAIPIFTDLANRHPYQPQKASSENIQPPSATLVDYTNLQQKIENIIKPLIEKLRKGTGSASIENNRLLISKILGNINNCEQTTLRHLLRGIKSHQFNKNDIMIYIKNLIAIVNILIDNYHEETSLAKQFEAGLYDCKARFFNHFNPQKSERRSTVAVLENTATSLRQLLSTNQILAPT